MTGRTRSRYVAGLALAAAIALVVIANAHLVWKAVQSQPDCVPHLKAPGAEGRFRAAQSSC